MALSSTTVFRVRGLPSNLSLTSISGIIERALCTPSDVTGLSITSLAEDIYQPREQVATLSFLKCLPEIFIATAASNEWPVHLLDADYDPTTIRSRTLTFDTHFRGLTVLNNPVNHEEAVDCVVVCGLGGHAFGSFKEKGTSYMWLRDSLPKDLPDLRILLYGYDSALCGSESTQNISGIALSFIGHLRDLRSQSETISRPLIVIAHSLGGLVVKQAIIKLSRGGDADKNQVQSIVGLIFFGVPHRGMDIESLRAMVGNQPNRYILESIGQYSDLLVEQDVSFGLDFHYKDSPIFSFFETKTSPIALKIDGSWKMAGVQRMLVGPFSAKHPRPWEPELHAEGFDRTHSDLVKFSASDVDYERVRSRLNEVTSKAKKILISRYLSQESTEDLSTDEQACLRTLAFTEMHSREGRVESAAPATGDWLLQSQDFQDWAQRKRLDEHHGFFWIQGNPGSGKSTLMKKAHLHIQALSHDPTSVIAPFYFNARGSEIEKSPTGLFRTLLYTLCQRISALRTQVMKVYRRKCGLLNPGWEWQFHELKELLSSVVTVSILGQRNLVLCVDALDECDLVGAKSVIQFFEQLAKASVRENTKLNICLSSRYWPQFTIQHCFKTRVELENHADIARYIQQHMETMQIGVTGNNQLAVLEAKLRKKANGTFLWVVLVLQELLYAYENGATLGEIDRILHEVPSDLQLFYQHQMDSTRSDDRRQMLSMLQCVFYSLRPLSPTELRYLVAFGHEDFSSYSEWEQSNGYVMSDAQMERRIREKSKGLIEMAKLPKSFDAFKDVNEPRTIVQFIHQSVRDFLSENGFESLRRGKIPNDAASGHEFMKTACFNYLNTTDLKELPILDFRFYSDHGIRHKMDTLPEDHPLLEYAADHLFPHAALVEKHGIQQDGLRSHISGNIQGSFERWKYLKDLISILRVDWKPIYFSPLEFDCERGLQGPEARPLHVFAQYGLLAPGVAIPKENPNVRGGLYDYPLFAAAAEGHQGAVQYLLMLGADPQIWGRRCETAYGWAAACGYANVLQLLLEHPLSVKTLQERLEIARWIDYPHTNKTHHNILSPLQVHEILALLIPEDTIPVSAIDQILGLFTSPTAHTLVITLLLDKCEKDICRHKDLLYKCFESQEVKLPSIQKLLDCVESIEISEELLDALINRGRVSPEADVETLTRMLFEHGKVVEITENFIDKVSLMRNSSQLLHQLVESGVEMPPLTCRQTMSALSNGSPESVSFFVRQAPDDASSDEMLLAAVQNKMYAPEAVRVLLGLRNTDSICEATVISSLKNRNRQLSLLKTFEDRWGTLVFSIDALITALSYSTINAVDFMLSRCKHFNITEIHILATFRGLEDRSGTVNLLLEYDPTFRVSEKLVARTVAEFYGENYLAFYVHHGNPLVLTEEVVKAAACNWLSGVESLAIILQHNSDAKISNTMILEVLHSRRGAVLITLLLEHDPSIAMQEDFLIAAASNTHEGAVIFEALHQKGRISFSTSAVEATDGPPANRQRLSLGPSPSLRVNRTKTAQITTKVIEAAAANSNRRERWRMLSLFHTWGVLTKEELDIY